MGGFRELKHGQKKRIILHTEGPRSHAEAQAFRKQLLALLKKHRTGVVGYRASVKAKKAKPKAKKSARKRKRR